MALFLRSSDFTWPIRTVKSHGCVWLSCSLSRHLYHLAVLPCELFWIWQLFRQALLNVTYIIFEIWYVLHQEMLFYAISGSLGTGSVVEDCFAYLMAESSFESDLLVLLYNSRYISHNVAIHTLHNLAPFLRYLILDLPVSDKSFFIILTANRSTNELFGWFHTYM